MLISSQVINKILQTKDYSIIKQNGLDKSYFKGYEDEFEFIDNHFKQFGNVPDEQTFLSKFSTFELYQVAETDKYLLDKLYEEKGYNKFAPIIPKLVEILKQDSRDAYDFLLDNLANIKPEGNVTGHNIIADAEERYIKYLDKLQAPNEVVISTGFPELDDIFHGWEFEEELVTIMARINVGKSWLLMKFLTEAWKQGYTVGLYSGEMNHIKLGYRFDALFEHLSNRALTWGSTVDNYKQFIDRLKILPTPFIITTQPELGGKATVPKLRRFVESNNIQILGIDQFSLMEDVRSSTREQNRIKMARISEDLYLMSSELKIPILALAQANRAAVDKSEDVGLGMENVKESDDIAANSSKVMGLRQTGSGVLVMDIIKNRFGKVGTKLMYNWDIDKGVFQFIPSGDNLAPVTPVATNNPQASFSPNPF